MEPGPWGGHIMAGAQGFHLRCVMMAPGHLEGACLSPPQQQAPPPVGLFPSALPGQTPRQAPHLPWVGPRSPAQAFTLLSAQTDPDPPPPTPDLAATGGAAPRPHPRPPGAPQAVTPVEKCVQLCPVPMEGDSQGHMS